MSVLLTCITFDLHDSGEEKHGGVDRILTGLLTSRDKSSGALVVVIQAEARQKSDRYDDRWNNRYRKGTERQASKLPS